MLCAQPALGPELIAKVKEELSARQHFLVRLRIVHPVVAALTAAIVIGVMGWLGRRMKTGWTTAAVALVGLQAVMGLANIWLAAPEWLQLAHLLGAQLVWVCVVAVWLE
ncbi:MAG: COX15/CtaA family protein [Acidobacteriota bacterium]